MKQLEGINDPGRVKISVRQSVPIMRNKISDTVHSPKDMDKHYDFSSPASIADKHNTLVQKVALADQRLREQLQENKLLSTACNRATQQYIDEKLAANQMED